MNLNFKIQKVERKKSKLYGNMGYVSAGPHDFTSKLHVSDKNNIL